MRSVQKAKWDRTSLKTDLDELNTFVTVNEHLGERSQILPFFRSRPTLSMALGTYSRHITEPDHWGTEVSLFGDFTVDLAVADSIERAVALIEFEDMSADSILRKTNATNAVPKWSSRYEVGFSQLVDWAWRIDSEQGSAAERRIFGFTPKSYFFVLVIGHTKHIDEADQARVAWRSRSVAVYGWNINAITYDAIPPQLMRRYGLA